MAKVHLAMKTKLAFIIFVLVALPHFSYADFISHGNAGATIITDNGSVFVPGSPGLVAISAAPIIPSPFLVNRGSTLAVVPVRVPASQVNFTGVNSLLGTPGPGSGSLLGTPALGTAPPPGSTVLKNVIIVNPAHHQGKNGGKHH
jgi:hypothetical protein